MDDSGMMGGAIRTEDALRDVVVGGRCYVYSGMTAGNGPFAVIRAERTSAREGSVSLHIPRDDVYWGDASPESFVSEIQRRLRAAVGPLLGVEVTP